MAPLHILPMNSLPGFFPGRMAVSRQHTPRLRIVRETTVFLTAAKITKPAIRVNGGIRPDLTQSGSSTLENAALSVRVRFASW